MKPKEEAFEIVKGDDGSIYRLNKEEEITRAICQKALEWEITEELRRILLKKLSSLD